VATFVLAVSCAKQETPEPERWTSSLSMEPQDWSTAGGPAAWSNAVDALRWSVVEQQAKVEIVRSAGETKTVAADLNKQERILAALRERLKEELANKPGGL